MRSNDLPTDYLGIPQLDKLTNDLRASDLSREAPSLSIPEAEYEAMTGSSLWTNGKHYKLVDDRQSQSQKSGTSTQFGDCLGTFKLESGQLALFCNARLPQESKIRPTVLTPPRILKKF